MKVYKCIKCDKQITGRGKTGLCHSCSQINRFKNKNSRKIHSNKIKIAMNKPSIKTKRSRFFKNKFKNVENHPRWKGGKVLQNGGYVYVHRPHSKRKYIAEHRLVMEKHVNRKLKPTEIVHHINGKKDDNRIENLILFPNQSAHLKFKHLNKKTFICKNCGKNQCEL